MKQAFYLTSLILGLAATASGQQIKVVRQLHSGTTYYSGHDKHINSLEQIPVKIRLNVEGFLQLALGDLASGVDFSHGQVINRRQYFKEEVHEAFQMGWIVPKYDLHFCLSAPALGIETFNFQIRLDQYGQIVSSTWPREGYNGEKRFKPRREVDRFAIGLALKEGYDTSDYCVDLRFSRETETLEWAFIFPSESNRNRVGQGLVIACKELELVAYTTQRCRNY